MSSKSANYKLYLDRTSPYCQRVQIVAGERHVPYETVEVDAHALPESFKQINPRSMVPALQISDTGDSLVESVLISQFVDGVGDTKSASLFGTDALQRHRIEFFVNQLSYFISAAFDLTGDGYNAEKRKEMDANAAYIEELLAANQTSGPYFYDDTFTFADVAVVPFLIRFKPVLSYCAAYDLFAKAPRLKRLWAAAIQRPAVRESTIATEKYISSFFPLVPKGSILSDSNCGYVLFTNYACPFAERARLACAAKKIQPFSVEVALHPTPSWFAYVNPRETVPVLLTPQGEYIHESTLIVQYLDDAFAGEGAELFPRDDAKKKYAVGLFVDTTNLLTDAMFAVLLDPTNAERRPNLQFAGHELEKLLAAEVFGTGPFCGGTQINGGDIVLLPMLQRLQAVSPKLTGGYDLLAECPRLTKLLEAAGKSDAAREVLLDTQRCFDTLAALQKLYSK